MRIPRFLEALLLAGTAIMTATACDAVSVFDSAANDGVMTAPPTVLPDGNSVVLNLFIKNLGNSAPSAPETVCNGGAGAEVCLWSVRVDVTGGAQLVSFQSAPNVRFNLAGNVLRVTGGNPISPTTAADRIGTLTVRAVSPGSISAAGEYVSSRFVAQPVPQSTLFTANP